MRTLNSANADDELKEQPHHLYASNSQASRLFNRNFGGGGGPGARGEALGSSLSAINPYRLQKDQEGFAALGFNRNL